MAYNIIENDTDPFLNIYNEKYTYQYIKDSGFSKINDQLIELALQGRKEIEYVKLIE